MKKVLIVLCCAVAALASCVATAPVSIAWRSNASQQYATTEAMAAVNTSSGTATTNDNSGAAE